MAVSRLSFVLILVLLLPTPCYSRSKRHKTDQTWKTKRKDCAATSCSHLHVDESDNCVNECVDPGCYGEVYGPESEKGPLEDGELDPARYRVFINCVRKTVRERKKEKDKRRREERDMKNRVVGVTEDVGDEAQQGNGGIVREVAA